MEIPKAPDICNKYFDIYNKHSMTKHKALNICWGIDFGNLTANDVIEWFLHDKMSHFTALSNISLTRSKAPPRMERMNYAEFVNAAKEKRIDSYLIDGYF